MSMSAEYGDACGGGGFSGCRNKATVKVSSDIGGWFGNLCDDCADYLNHQMERRMRENWRRYHRAEVENNARQA